MWHFPDLTRATFARRREKGIALITVLSLVVIVSLILVAFVAAMRIERAASFSYSQSVAAEQVARGAMNLVVAELQNEMEKDALPDLTFPSKPLYTNVTSSNIVPQYVGTNSSMPNLVKVSGTAAPFSGNLRSGRLIATAVNTATAAKNGRFISTNRWNLPGFGSFPSSASTPNWVMVTRAGATNAAGLAFGATGATLNNPVATNVNFAVGRFAYAIYDVGGLLDITIAGYPASLSAAQIQQIKGRLSGLEVNQTNFSINPDDLLGWRNRSSAASAAGYLSYATNFLATNTPGQVYPGDNVFLSRQDLIKAAKDGIAGLSTNALTNLTTFSRDRNAPSWSPTFNSADLGGTNAAAFAYRNNAMVSTAAPFSAASPNPNRLVPGARFPVAGTVTSYRNDGSSYSYTVQAGDPVAGRRFPLGRLAWIGPNGPQNGGTAEAIQACFGLVWGPSEDVNLPGVSVWKYAGPTGSTSVSTIKTLSQIADESSRREPNFFELLQAGILQGSLGVTDRTASAVTNNGYFPSRHQSNSMFQILRIGAAAIDQYDADSFPTVLEFNPQTAMATERYQACGLENLPSVSMVTAILGAPAGSQTVPAVAPTATTRKAAVYLMFGLWNPNRNAETTASVVPEVRLRVRGGLATYMYFGSSNMFSGFVGGDGSPEFGYDVILDHSVELATTPGSGRDGFRTGSLALSATDVNPADTAYQNTPQAAGPDFADGGRWERTHPLGGNPVRTDLVGLRLPDMEYNLGTDYHDTTVVSATHSDSNFVYGYGAPTSSSVTLGTPFNVIMEFKSNGAWIPYQHFVGINSPYTWLRGALGTRLPALSMSPDAGYHGPTPPKSFYFPNFVTPLSEETLPRVGTVNGASQTVGFFLQINYYGPSEAPPGPGVVRVAAPAWERSELLLSSDPQSSRLKSWLFRRSWRPDSLDLSDHSMSINAGNNSTLWLNSADSKYPSGFGGVTTGAPFNGPAALTPPERFPSRPYLPAQFARNNNNAGFASTQSGTNTANTVLSSYQDRDGLLRIADSGIYTSPSSAAGNPYINADDQRIILNRPFRSVAELGFVFRDAPWKTLDFFTTKSGDSGLLDLFTISDSPNAVVAGTVNLNARNPVLLSAILNGSVADVISGNPIGAPSLVASGLAAFTTTNALVNKSQLATAFGPSLTASSFTSTEEENIKNRREGFVRALVDVGQTRTWNLCVDVIAQSGRYSLGATSLDQFVVESERRLWLHIAIDRFTGEIIDQRIEPVIE
jgi:hypothetical protein